MSGGQIITPGSMGIPMGITLSAVAAGEGKIDLVSRREEFVKVALAAILGRETATLLSASAVAMAAVAVADATLAAMGAQSIAPAKSPPAPPAPPAG